MGHEVHNTIELYTIIPFLLMLLGIAVGPIFFHHKWEKNSTKLSLSLILGIPTAIFLLLKGFSHELTHQMLFDYVPFIILLGALFVITGGILLTGFIPTKPGVNTLFLGIGAILASFMGTTGAAMILIRPLLVTNSERKNKVHTVLFFIAIVANCGGLLTPLGDPPLFLLYLRGAPFTWFFELLPEWLFINISLLSIYYLVDLYFYKREALIAGIPVSLLTAISVGAVFFGSMTYIGNGPNFMVKAIAENNNIKMPHFFRYMYGFSLIVLLPLFILASFIFIK